MLDTIHTRRRGAQDFEAYYDQACSKQDTTPSPAVKVNLPKGVLDFNGDRLRVSDWQPIISAIAINKHLHHIAISSSYQAGLTDGELDSRLYRSSVRNRVPAIRSKELTLKLCRALRECLASSPHLKTLQLKGLPLRERDIVTLTKGLAKSKSLESLSLANCPIADEGLEAICQSVKYSFSIKTVDFSGCNLTWRGAEHMAGIIKHQAVRRHGAAWAESLRYRRPEFEGMEGLRRVTLNRNTLIGDQGAAALAKELAEDLWLKAVDLQKCGLSNEGARCLVDALKTNSTLCVLDIRSNPLVEKALVKTVIEKVLVNADGLVSQYDWIKPPETKETQKSPVSHKRRVQLSTNGHRGKISFRIGIYIHGPSCSQRVLLGWQAKSRRCPATEATPWRQQVNVYSMAHCCARRNTEGAASVKVTLETESEEEEEEEEEALVQENQGQPGGLQERIATRQLTRLKVALEDCRVRLAEEHRARVQAETKVMEFELENARLRSTNFSLTVALQAPGSEAAASSVLEDDTLLDSIEGSFSKFHAFLDLLKDAGLGQLASIAGIDQTDFEPLGRPQLSSTVGRPLVGEGPMGGAGAGNQEVQDKVDDMRSVVPAVPTLQGNGFPSGAPAYCREVLLDLPPQEVPLLQPRSPVMDPCLEKDQSQRSQLEGSKLSGSEQSFRSNSFHSNKSHSNGFHGKRSHASASRGDVSYSRHHSHSNSRHSNSSHGYSLNYSNVSHAYSSALSDGSRSNSYRDDESLRSSMSDLSEKAGSKGISQAGPEGKGCTGPETPEQLGSVGSVGGASDDGF
ncbi:centrosomal protein of 78 kDa [Aplochiton taeniatus]